MESGNLPYPETSLSLPSGGLCSRGHDLHDLVEVVAPNDPMIVEERGRGLTYVLDGFTLDNSAVACVWFCM